MTSSEILEIHKNNMDLNIHNLSSISGKSVEEITSILKEDETCPAFLESEKWIDKFHRLNR
jgi:hypothetical protein